jgi:hypothetical protein
MSATYSVVVVTHPFDNPYRILERSCFRRLYAGRILTLMASTATFHESRRSTRVPLKVVIAIVGGAESRTCEGETIIVNLPGALIATAIGLSGGMRISIRIYLKGRKRADVPA